MPTDRALGEGGYSLTVLQSVMSCLQPHSGWMFSDLCSLS